MIFGHISTLQEDVSHLHKNLVKGLEYLAKTELATIAKGKHDIEGKDIYVAINEYETQPREVRRAEAHVEYIDIQYIISGQEMIAYSLLSKNNEVLSDELEAKDAIFYKTVQQETDLVMTEGMYAIFFPWDVHRPNCMLKEAVNVKKAVVKVKMSLLK